MQNNFYTCSTNGNNFYYSCSDWSNSHGPYDNRPWFGILPPPTYDDIARTITTSNIKFNTSTSDDFCDIDIDNKIISVCPKEIYKENIELKKKINSLNKELKYWKDNYTDVTPTKDIDRFDILMDILKCIDNKLKERT